METRKIYPGRQTGAQYPEGPVSKLIPPITAQPSEVHEVFSRQIHTKQQSRRGKSNKCECGSRAQLAEVLASVALGLCPALPAHERPPARVLGCHVRHSGSTRHAAVVLALQLPVLESADIHLACFLTTLDSRLHSDSASLVRCGCGKLEQSSRTIRHPQSSRHRAITNLFRSSRQLLIPISSAKNASSEEVF